MAKEVTRNFHMTDGDLTQRADLLESSIARDATDFADRGVDHARVALMTGARDAFSAHPNDELLEGLANNKRILKDDARTALLVELRKLRGMADTKYKGKGLYNTFGFKDMDNKTDNDLVRLAKGAIGAGTTLLSDLSTEGLTSAKLTALTALNTAFDNAVDEHRKAVQARDISTQTRVRLANTLYEYMVELANIGKSIFQDTDEAKYNDYVISDAPAVVYDGPGTYNGVVTEGQTVEVAHIRFNAARQIVMNNAGGSLLNFYLTNNVPQQEGGGVAVQPGATQTRAMDAFVNPGATHLIVINVGNGAGTYSVVVGAE